MSDAVLRVEGLTVALPTGADRPQAVSSVSFETQPGQLLCLVGESGSGKSMVAHTVMGLLPDNTMAGAERWAAEIAGPAYAIDDQTAIKVTDGTVEVVSEGHWKQFPS